MVQVNDDEKMEDLYFDFQADIGITKHMGALSATIQLIEMAQLNPQSAVLDIGCGVGFTCVHIAKTVGCRVYGVDKREKMITRAKKTAAKAGMHDQIDFRLADATDLPFEDKKFDTVLIESVNAFIDDKDAAFKEYIRFLKPKGKVLINEATWKKTPPEHVRIYMDKFMNKGDVLLAEEWKNLFKKAGFKKITAKINDIDMKADSSSLIKQMGWKPIFSAWGKTKKLYFSDPDYRRFLKAAIGNSSGGIVQFIDQMGYGLYSGEKA